MTSSCNRLLVVLPMLIPLRASFQRRRFFSVMVAAGLSLGVLGGSGCGSMMVSATEAQVRFADISVDAPALDVYLNGTGAAYNLGFATYSSYLPVSAGTYQFSANRANTGQALVSGRAALVSGHQYTAVVGNRLGTLQEHIYVDATPPAIAGTIAVRILNEVEGAPADVYLVPKAGLLSSAAPVAAGLAYGASAGYTRVTSNMSYGVFLVPTGSSPMGAGVMKVGGASVSGGSGTARTLILTEAAKDGKGLYGLVLEDLETP